MSERYGFNRNKFFATGLAAVAIAALAGEAKAAPTAQYGQEAVAGASLEMLNPAYLSTEALNEMNSGRMPNIISNSVVVIPGGNRIYSAPSVNAPNKVIGETDVALLQRFRLRLKNGVLWAATWDSRGVAQSGQAIDGKHTSWYDLSAASKTHGYEVYNYQSYNPDESSDYPFTFPVRPDAHKNLMVVSPSPVTHYNEIAVGAVFSVKYLKPQLEYLDVVPAQEQVRYIKASPVPPINPASAYNH